MKPTGRTLLKFGTPIAEEVSIVPDKFRQGLDIDVEGDQLDLDFNLSEKRDAGLLFFGSTRWPCCQPRRASATWPGYLPSRIAPISRIVLATLSPRPNQLQSGQNSRLLPAGVQGRGIQDQANQRAAQQSNMPAKAKK